MKKFYLLVLFFCSLTLSKSLHALEASPLVVSAIVDPHKESIEIFWKNDKQEIFRSIESLKEWLSHQNKELLLAMNGGMFQEDRSPLGLYIENQKMIQPINKRTGHGNFYLKPNGIFYITTQKTADILTTENWPPQETVRFATQSGPMLLIDQKINPLFTQGSTNLHIRNGVGVRPDGQVLFAISQAPINFYDFANFFKQQGCEKALYLDGTVSQAYIPEKNWIQLGGNFGVILGVTKKLEKNTRAP